MCDAGWGRPGVHPCRGSKGQPARRAGHRRQMRDPGEPVVHVRYRAESDGIRQRSPDIQFSNRDLTGDAGEDNGLTRAWLSSSLQISPGEQIQFLRMFLLRDLPFSAEAVEKTIASMPVFAAGEPLIQPGLSVGATARGGCSADLSSWFDRRRQKRSSPPHCVSIAVTVARFARRIASSLDPSATITRGARPRARQCSRSDARQRRNAVGRPAVTMPMVVIDRCERMAVRRGHGRPRCGCGYCSSPAGRRMSLTVETSNRLKSE